MELQLPNAVPPTVGCTGQGGPGRAQFELSSPEVALNQFSLFYKAQINHQAKLIVNSTFTGLWKNKY